MFEVLNTILLLILIIITVYIILSKHLLITNILMCVFSVLNTLAYVTLNAPDVALTEASVGAGLSTVLTCTGLGLIKKHKLNIRYSPIRIILMIFLMILITHFMSYMPVFGMSDTPIHMNMKPNYIEKTQEEIGIPNIVTAILASFRSYDTLGEILVVFTSALCITLILKKDKEQYDA
ncbi:DUF4040 domain-containing protein [Wolbachia endosymbiont of Howardula sp.]|uniref:DUF4040 domain-containing protein n=1 Tax=Wolbachia endosymbiont of Howardula sp. TaxID=2916816 RepID=UPI00217E0B7C|nr:DUF4040 domain-containing protein [Wolbachia endosymbiont of Howardula sp.]UWI83004.1 DUF4040 domain-containing protein [Wolbachia endosymbiont of Howardula sp.]